MKIKRVAALFLSLVMVLSLVCVPAYAAPVDELKSDIVLTEGVVGGKSGIYVDWKITTGTVNIMTANIAFAYDKTVFDLVDASGNALAFSAADPPVLNDAQLIGDSSFTFANDLYAKDGTGNTAIVAFVRSKFTADIIYATSTTIGQCFLAYKDTKSISDVTAETLRLATAAEAETIGQSSVVGMGDESFTEYKYGTKDSSDTAGWASNITFGKDFDFAKPAYTGTAATVSSVAKSGSNVVVTATIPSGETGEYGYSATNSAASVTNWQSSNSFATPEPGTYYFFARVAENGTHKAGGESAGTSYTVNGPLSLSYTAPASMTVDTAISEMAPTVSGGSGTYTNYAVTAGTLPTGLSLNATTGKISGTPTAVAAAADVTITVTDSDSDTQTYVIHFPAVAKKANTMTSVTQADVEYGTEVNPSVNACNGTTPTYQYKVRGEDDGTYTDTKPTAVGEYTVKASSTGHATVADAVVTADFAITQKTLTNLGFTGVTVTKVYDGTTSAGAVGGSAITFTGKVGTDDVSIKAVAGEYTDANVGTGKTVTLTLSLDGAAKDNYKLASYSETFNAAAITVADYTYTVAATQTFRTGSGLSAITVAPAAGTGVNSESVTGTLKWYTDNGYSTEATDTALSSLAANASVTLYWQFTATDSNYTNTPKTGSTVFTAKDKEDLSTSIDVSGITGLSKTYNGEAASYTGSATVTGHTGLDSSLVYEWYKADNTKLAEAPKNVGSYYLKVSIPDANVDFMGSNKVDFTISKREVTVEAGTYMVSKEYDGYTTTGTASGTLSVSGILPADSDVTVQASPVAYTSNGVGGQSSMNVNIALNGTGSENYKIKDDATTVTVPCEIRAKAITINTATATGRDYAAGNVSVETDVTFTGAIGTLTKGTDYTVTGEMDDANAGTKTVNVTVTLANNNYSLAANTTTTTVTIDKIDYTISTPITGSAKYGTTGSVDLGSYKADGGSFGTVTVTEDTYSVLSGAPAMNDDSLEFTFVNDAGKADKTATIKVAVNGATNYNNYEITVTVTVNPKTIPTVTAPTAVSGLTYDGTARALINAGATNGGEMQYSLTSGSGYSTAIPTATNAGTYTVYYKVVGDSEYADVAEASVSVTIAKKDVTVAPKSFTITKGNTIPTFELEYTGLVGSDTLTPSVTPDFTCYETGTTPVSTTTAAGTYTITWTNEGATTFTGADNYNVAKTATGTLTINNPAPIGGGVTTYSITVDSAKNGTVTVSRKSASKGTTVTITAEPDEGHVLRTLTVVDEKGAEVELTDKGEGKYSFVMPDSKVTVTGSFKCSGGELCVSHTFTDVDTGKWYHEAIDYVIEHNLMNGVGGGLFAPNGDTYRGTLLTILYRLEGEPEVDSGSVFSDVPEGAWYHDAVLWAASNGIVEGYGNGVFGAKDPITREQFAAILYRYAQYKGYDVTARGDLSTYTDGASTHGWAKAALSWANAVGIIDGLGENLIDPTGGAIRAQAAKMLFQFCKIFME